MWLSWQAASGLLYFWPVTLVLAGVVVAVGVRSAKRQDLTVRCLVWSIVPGLVPLVLLVWGTLFERADSGRAFGDLGWRSNAVTVLLVAIVPLVAFVVWRVKQCRWFATACGALAAWSSVWAAFVAGMSVTGDWI